MQHCQIVMHGKQEQTCHNRINAHLTIQTCQTLTLSTNDFCHRQQILEGGASFITDSWKKPVLLLAHGSQEPYYYYAYKHGPLLKAIMLHFEELQFSVFFRGVWGG